MSCRCRCPGHGWGVSPWSRDMDGNCAVRLFTRLRVLCCTFLQFANLSPDASPTPALLRLSFLGGFHCFIQGNSDYSDVVQDIMGHAVL
jgi:hypothetical protein